MVKDLIAGGKTKPTVRIRPSNPKMYKPSTRLFKVIKKKSTKGEPSLYDVGVVEQAGRSLVEVNELLAQKRNPAWSYEALALWIGWERMGEVVTDDWMIKRYGLLEPALSEL